MPYVELDGEIHDRQKEYDENREAEIEKYGLRILRFKNSEVFDDIEGVIEKIKKCL